MRTRRRSPVEIPRHNVVQMELGRLAAARVDWNPRRISRAARSRLKASLERFGMAGALVFNEKSGNLVSGHQRVDVLLEELPPDVQVPVVVVSLDEADERALNVQLNRQDVTGDFDADLLGKLLADLPESLTTDLALDDLPGWAQPDAAEDLAAAIAQEEEWQPGATSAEDRDRLADRLAAHIRRLPLRALDRAILVCLPLRRGNKVLVLADPSAQDLADELERLHAAGVESPLDSLGERLWEEDASGPSPTFQKLETDRATARTFES